MRDGSEATVIAWLRAPMLVADALLVRFLPIFDAAMILVRLERPLAALHGIRGALAFLATRQR